MKDENKTKAQLVDELNELRQRVEKLDAVKPDLEAVNKRLQQENRAREQAEEAFREQKVYLQKAIDALTHPFYVINAGDYTIKLANTTSNFGPLTNRTFCYALTHGRTEPCSGDDDPCPLEKIRETKRPVTVEHIHYDGEGRSWMAEVHAYPVFDEEGELKEIIEYSLDITERKQAEEALKESEEHLQLITDNVPGLISYVDKDMKYRFVNAGYERWFGTKREAFVGKKVSDLLDETAIKRSLPFIQRALNGEEVGISKQKVEKFHRKSEKG